MSTNQNGCNLPASANTRAGVIPVMVTCENDANKTPADRMAERVDSLTARSIVTRAKAQLRLAHREAQNTHRAAQQDRNQAEARLRQSYRKLLPEAINTTSLLRAFPIDRFNQVGDLLQQFENMGDVGLKMEAHLVEVDEANASFNYKLDIAISVTGNQELPEEIQEFLEQVKDKVDAEAKAALNVRQAAAAIEDLSSVQDGLGAEVELALLSGRSDDASDAVAKARVATSEVVNGFVRYFQPTTDTTKLIS